jgi:hypothetical protein
MQEGARGWFCAGALVKHTGVDHHLESGQDRIWRYFDCRQAREGVTVP